MRDGQRRRQRLSVVFYNAMGAKNITCFFAWLSVSFPAALTACGSGQDGIVADAARAGDTAADAGDAAARDVTSEADSPLDRAEAASDAPGEDRAAIDSGGFDGSSESGDAGGCVAPAPAPNGGACNGLAAQGAPVVPTCSASAVPTAEGGAIQDGTYVLETTTLYGAACSTQTARITWVICGPGWSTVQDVSGPGGSTDAGAPLLHLTASASVQGAAITLNVTCSSDPGLLPAPRMWGYTASPGLLTLLIPQPGGGLRADAFRLR